MTDRQQLLLGLGIVVAIIGVLLFSRSDGPIDQAGSPSEQMITSGAGQIDEDRVIAADEEPGSWLAHGRTYSEQRYSPLTNINTDNVGDLGLAWSFDTNTDRGLEASPIVVDGVMYLTGSWSVTYALDARTGEMLWEYDPEVPKEWGRNACCDVVNRGVAVWKGQVFVGTIDGYLVALDAETGKVNWKVNTIDRTRPYTITGAPRVIKGKVIIGNGGSELGVRGYFTAYDADSGKQVWRFYTVPGNPADGFEHPELEEAAKTWKGGKWWEIGGGGTVWDSMAYDPDLNLLYVGTGNGSPWARHIRSPGGGDNLYLSSILAINPDTGRLVWHYQTTPGETWDYTATQHMILAELEIDGANRKVIMQAPKNGFFYVLDRATGELLSADKYALATWASHVDLETGRPVETDSRWADEGKVLFPAALGGHNWHPMAFNPDTGLVYIPAMDILGIYEPEEGFKYRKGAWNTGSDFATLIDGDPAMAGGKLLAWDPVKKAPAWEVPHWGAWNGGILTTAGNLVFQGTGDGFFSAYRADDGTKLWQHPAGTGIIAPAVTYEIDGEQYVTVLAGWGGAFALVFGRAADAAGVEKAGRVLTFKLGADGTIPGMEMEEDAELTLLPDTTTDEYRELGEQTFARTCAVCHGVGAVGGGVIPDLRRSAPSVFDNWDEIVFGGLLKHNGMAAFGDVITKEELDAIKAYVIHRAHEGDIPSNAVVLPVDVQIDLVQRVMGSEEMNRRIEERDAKEAAEKAAKEAAAEARRKAAKQKAAMERAETIQTKPAPKAPAPERAAEPSAEPQPEPVPARQPILPPRDPRR